MRKKKIDTNDPKVREKFLEAWLDLDDPVDAALAAFPGISTNEAYRVGEELKSIDSLRKEKETLLEEFRSDEAILPSANEYSYEIWKQIKNCQDPVVAVKLLELYGKTQGFLRKLNDGGSKDSVPIHKVLAVPTTGTEKEWEQALQLQQKKLNEYRLKEDKGKRKVSS